MAGIDNLTHFQPGQSGNPAGKKKGTKNRATILREILALVGDDGKTSEYHINLAIVNKAMTGDVSAYKEIQDTMYGKVPDKVLNAETTPEELDRDYTQEVLKHVPTDILEEILNVDNNKSI